MSICGGCGRLVGLLACHRAPCRSLAVARSLFLVGLRAGASSVCGCLLHFVRGCVVVSIAVSSRIRYRMM